MAFMASTDTDVTIGHRCKLGETKAVINIKELVLPKTSKIITFLLRPASKPNVLLRHTGWVGILLHLKRNIMVVTITLHPM